MENSKREIKFRAWDKNMKAMVYIWTDLRILVRVDSPVELMQYTGLKDKNDKEIYEGDIVKVEGFILKVVWYELAACFRYLDDAHNLLSPLNYDDPEIIGNIYDNPELINLNKEKE